MIKLRSATPSPSLSDIIVFTLQGHPEFTEAIVNDIIDVREKGGILSKDFAQASRERSALRQDGSALGRTILEILNMV